MRDRERDREEKRRGNTESKREREEERKMGIVQATASTIKKAQDYASHSERTRKIERDQKKYLVVVVLITTLKIERVYAHILVDFA